MQKVDVNGFPLRLESVLFAPQDFIHFSVLLADKTSINDYK